MLEQALRKDRLFAIFGLLLATGLAWGYLIAGAGMSMHEMDGMFMATRDAPWTPGDAAVIFVMWAVMMAAMMLPAAAPMILLYGVIARGRRAKGSAAVPTGIFASGYLLVWLAFSLAATGMQYGLEKADLLTPMMQTTSTIFAAAVLICAGLYQWTPLKQTCLRRCRAPLDFIMTYWREGVRGALNMGVRHGLYCVGCCWMLMLLLFVGGVMNLAWIAGLAAFVLVEKLAPEGHWVARVTGALLILWGVAVLLHLA